MGVVADVERCLLDSQLHCVSVFEDGILMSMCACVCAGVAVRFLDVAEGWVFSRLHRMQNEIRAMTDVLTLSLYLAGSLSLSRSLARFIWNHRTLGTDEIVVTRPRSRTTRLKFNALAHTNFTVHTCERLHTKIAVRSQTRTHARTARQSEASTRLRLLHASSRAHWHTQVNCRASSHTG